MKKKVMLFVMLAVSVLGLRASENTNEFPESEINHFKEKIVPYQNTVIELNEKGRINEYDKYKPEVMPYRKDEFEEEVEKLEETADTEYSIVLPLTEDNILE